jgi:hypothetical protein
MLTGTLLSQSVQQLASLTQGIADPELDRAWAWHEYDEEGIRFAFFRTYEELRELAVKLRQERARRGRSPSVAQLILADYHAAYNDLQAALLGVGTELCDRAPAENEWPVRRTLAHIVGADVGFFVVIKYALDRHRTNDARPAKVSDEAWDGIVGLDEAAYQALLAGPFDALREYHDVIHARVVRELAEIRDEEIEAPSVFWESEPMTLRFRLHRFDSHMRQHTIQIDKTLVYLGHAPTEVRRLQRLIYGALGEVEGGLVGAEEIGEGDCRAVAEVIRSRTQDIEDILG